MKPSYKKQEEKTEAFLTLSWLAMRTEKKYHGVCAAAVHYWLRSSA